MELFLDGSTIIELPSSIGCLNGLVLLNLKNCKKLAGLPQSICELTSLRTLILSSDLLKGKEDKTNYFDMSMPLSVPVRLKIINCCIGLSISVELGRKAEISILSIFYIL